MNGEGLSVADALALRDNGYGVGYGGGFGGFGNGFGGDGWWIIILLLLFGNGNWGNNGFGGGGWANACCAPATMQGVNDAINTTQLANAIDNVQSDVAAGAYNLGSTLQNGFAQTQLGMCQGFNGVQRAICDSDFHNQTGFNNLSNQIGFLACDIEKGQDTIRYDIATQSNAIIAAVDKNTDRVIDYLNQAEMDRLRNELQTARFQISQSEQTADLVNQLLPVARPAYITCSPYASAFGYPYNNGNYGGCGCGCGN